MNKLLIVFFLTACFVAVSAHTDENDHQVGGYAKATYNPETENEVYDLAVSKILSFSENSQINSIPRLQAFYKKIVSGVMYKLIIVFGANTYQVEVWS